MNFKTTYVLFGLLIAVLGVFLITQLVGKKTTDTYVFPSLKKKAAPVEPKDIETVEIELHRPRAEKMVFVKSGQGWRLREPNVRATGREIDDVVRQVMDLQFDPEAEVTKNLDQFGLKSPAAVVTLVQKDGDKKWTLNVGNVGGGLDAMAFVNSSDRPGEVLAVRRGSLSPLLAGREGSGTDGPFKTANDYRSRDLLPTSAFDYQYVSLQDGKQKPVILEREGTENRWLFKEPKAYGTVDEGEGGFGRDAGQQSGMQGLLSNLSSLRVESAQDFVADNVAAGDLAKYGLEDGNPERLRIEVKSRDTSGGPDAKKESVTAVLLIGKKVEDKMPDQKKPEGKKPDEKKPDDKKVEDREEKYYAVLDEGENNPRSVVKVSSKLRDQIVMVLQNPSALRSRDLVSLPAAGPGEKDKIDQIDWIEVDNGKEKFQLAKTGPDGWELIDQGKARKADGEAIRKLLTLLRDRRQIKEYVEGKNDAELGLDRPSAEVSFWVQGRKEAEKEAEKKEPEKKQDEQKEGDQKDDKAADKDAKQDGDKKEEKKDDKKAPPVPAKPKGPPTVKLTFGKKDKDVLYVQREMGEHKVRVAIAAADTQTREEVLPRVTQEKLAYLDRKLPDFPRDQVVKLAIVRDGQTYELDKEEKDGKATWKFTQPDTLKGRTAETARVVRILDELSGPLYADQVVADVATESELERYGLKSPAYKATVTWKKGDKDTESLTYVFGKDADDKGRFHARISDRDWVFLMRGSVLAPLKDELADTTVFTFDPEKVKQLKLTGWQKVGFLIKLDLERKSRGDWSVKDGPPGFQLSARKVESFLGELARLKAQRFVVLKGGAKPEHELETAKGALEIEITLDGEKEPWTLTIRDPKADSKDKTCYAKSNKLPGDVFVLPESLVKGVLDAPGYFGQAVAGKP